MVTPDEYAERRKKHALDDLDQLWNSAAGTVEMLLVSEYRQLLRDAKVRSVVEDTVLLTVPDARSREIAETVLRPAIAAALSAEIGRPVTLAVTIRPDAGPDAPAPMVFLRLDPSRRDVVSVTRYPRPRPEQVACARCGADDPAFEVTPNASDTLAGLWISVCGRCAEPEHRALGLPIPQSGVAASPAGAVS